jgi:leucyl aminopeptidase
LAEASSEEDFTGKAGQTVVLRLPGFGFKRVGLIGVGQIKDPTAIAYKGIGEAVATVAKTAQACNVAIVVVSTHEGSPESKLHAAFSIATGNIFLQTADGLTYIVVLLDLVSCFCNVNSFMVMKRAVFCLL